jgi:prephenate dehydrogenase
LARLDAVSIVGVGLIGGSIGRALRSKGLAGRVIGVGRDVTRLAEARRLGAIDEGTTDFRAGVAGSAVVVVCTPVSRIAATACEAARLCDDRVLITDAGSTKRTIVEAVERDERARSVFVGAHPIAGSARQGVAAAQEDLFEGRPCVLCPTRFTPQDHLDRARRFWTSLGSRVSEMDPQAHDDALAMVSHLPHAVAAALAAVVPEHIVALAGGAFRDSTRVAAASAELWTEIFLENHLPVLRAVETLQLRLTCFHDALLARDAAALRDWWERGRLHRLSYENGNLDHSG